VGFSDAPKHHFLGVWHAVVLTQVAKSIEAPNRRVIWEAPSRGSKAFIGQEVFNRRCEVIERFIELLGGLSLIHLTNIHR